MGHPIEHQASVGSCRLTRCSCGRSALEVGGKVLLLSSAQAEEVRGLFGALEPRAQAPGDSLAVKLKWVSGGREWAEFSPKIPKGGTLP